MQLLAISGSLRRGSYNSALLRAAAVDCLSGVEFVLWTGLGDIPAYNEDLDAVPSPVAELRDEIARSDAVLIATPEYNASVPGALKNALDWVSRPLDTNPLRNKPSAVIGASEGLFGAIWAQAELRKILRAIGAQVDERGLAVARAHRAFTADARLRDPSLALTLTAIVEDLICRTRQRAA
jgi:chromate reductase